VLPHGSCLAGSEPGLQIGKLLTKIKTLGTAANLAKLPELLRKDRWAGVV
jgi:hypothetical protein